MKAALVAVTIFVSFPTSLFEVPVDFERPVSVSIKRNPETRMVVARMIEIEAMTHAATLARSYCTWLD